MPMNEAHGLPDPEPAIANGINHIANLAMEKDISMSFLMNNFDVSAALGDSGALNDETWLSNDGFGNLAPDFFGLNNGNLPSFDIPENFMDVLDELYLNTTAVSLSNPGGSNNERVVALDNAEVEVMSSTSHPSIASAISFNNSFLGVFDSEFDISALSISNPQVTNPELSFAVETPNVVASSYPDNPSFPSIINFDSSGQVAFDSLIELDPQPTNQPDVSEVPQDSPRTQIVPKPKFKRRNQVVSEGNNKVGRKGILRCEACRKIHSKCKFATDVTCCE